MSSFVQRRTNKCILKHAFERVTKLTNKGHSQRVALESVIDYYKLQHSMFIPPVWKGNKPYKYAYLYVIHYLKQLLDLEPPVVDEV